MINLLKAKQHNPACVCVELTSLSGISIVVESLSHTSIMKGCPCKLSESQFHLNIHTHLYQDTHTDDLVPTYTYLSFENVILMGLCLFDNVGVSFCHVNGLDMCKFVFLHIAVKVITHVCVRGWMSVSSIFFTHCATLTALRPQILYVCPEDNLLFRGFFFVVYGVVMEFSDIYLR